MFIKKSLRSFLFFVCLSLGIFSLINQAFAQDALKDAILLNVKGGIGPATKDFISRGLKTAAKQQAKAVILQIDTPGGLSSSMRGIIQDILASPVPVISYVAPSGARAASAGTYILYASHVAAMAPGTNLGAATPVNLTSPGTSPEKDKQTENKKTEKSASEQKALNDARAYIRSLAQLRNRNVRWAEKAVTEAASLSATEALKLNVIDLVAKNLDDLLQKTNGRQVSVNGKTETLSTLNLSIKEIEPDWRMKFLSVITDPSVAYILLMIGFYGLFFEFINPGSFVPGVLGAVCLLVGLYALQLLPINYAGLALIVLGLAFLIAEFFMPSFGILGIGGAISFIIGSVMLLDTDFAEFSLPIYLIIGFAIVTVGFFVIILNLAIRSRKRPIVTGQESLLQGVGQVEVRGDKMWIRIHGERWQCYSHQLLENGQSVKVKAVEGLKLLVEPIEK